MSIEKAYLTASCSLPQIVRECLNDIFNSVERHLLIHRKRHTVAIGSGQYETRYGKMTYLGLDFTVEYENGEICDYFEKEYLDGDVFITISCGCGENFVIATSIFENCGYEINAINYVEIVESFVKSVNDRYNKKNEDGDMPENKEAKNPLYGIDP